jgi:predicted transcriptional regulator
MSSQPMTRRSRGLSPERIIARILVLGETPTLQSELLNALLISRSTLSRYVTLLLGQGLLEKVELEGRTKLKTTSKGRELLRKGASPPTKTVKKAEESNDQDRDPEREAESRSRKSESRSAKWDLTSSIM